MSRGRLRTFRVCLSLAVLVATVGVGVCADETKAPQPPYSNNDMRAALSGNLGKEEKAKLDNYFNSFFFKRFKEPAVADDPPNLRKLYKILVRDAPKTPAHDELNKLVFGQLRTILSPGGKYSPTIKYNAMLLLSELNEDDKDIKPLPEAFKLLMSVVAMKDRPELDYLKPAALVGLVRLADVGGIPKDKTAEVTAVMLAMLMQKDPPPGRTTSAHNYLRRNAAHVLALLRNPGTDNAVAKAFEATLSDPQASLLTRCEMARFIGMLKYPPAAKVDLQGLANQLGHQAVEICELEVERADNPRQDKAGGVSRRLIMYVLETSDAGLQGLYDSAEKGSDSQKFIYALKNKVGSLLRTLGDLDETREAEVATIVRTEIEKIKVMLLAKPTDSGSLVAAGSKEEPAKPASTN